MGREYGVTAEWNISRLPRRDRRGLRRDAASCCRRIRFLGLPGACGPIRLDRFSPYFQPRSEFGLHNLRALGSYPLSLSVRSEENLARIAYYFDFDYEPAARASPAAHAAVRLAEALRDCADEGSLRALPHRDGGLHLADTRSQAKTAALKLSAFERCIVMRIDELSSVAQVMEALAQGFPTKRFAEEDVRAFLDELVDLEMALTDGSGNYLGLALMPAGLRAELEASSRRIPGTSRAAPNFVPMIHSTAGAHLHA